MLPTVATEDRGTKTEGSLCSRRRTDDGGREAHYARDGRPETGDRFSYTISIENKGGIRMIKEYKFQKLAVYELALRYVDEVYSAIKNLPKDERFNLGTQLRRAATSIPLNIAEGSTGQSDLEQGRFLIIAIRSYLETIACLDLIERRDYLDTHHLIQLRQKGHQVFIKLIALRKSLLSKHTQ